MLEWLRKVHATADLTMSVCNGSFVLAEAGLLDGRSATAHHGAYGSMFARYPEVTVVRGVRYVEDGSVATSGGLTSGIDLALRVVERFFGTEVAEQTALDLEYSGTGWKDPTANAVWANRPTSTPERPIDPICEFAVDASTALVEVADATSYYFCGDWCRRQFLASPERFISAG